MRAHLKYLGYIVRHKWFVLLAGLKTGAPPWRLVVHDWSKLTPAEWRPYVLSFNGPWPYDARPPWLVDAFNRAWLHHQHANPHHWQHWILRLDDGGIMALEMPEHFAREMVADWMGAGRAITGRWEVAEWYATNRARIHLNSATRALVESLIESATHHTRYPTPETDAQEITDDRMEEV